MDWLKYGKVIKEGSYRLREIIESLRNIKNAKVKVEYADGWDDDLVKSDYIASEIADNKPVFNKVIEAIGTAMQEDGWLEGMGHHRLSEEYNLREILKRHVDVTMRERKGRLYLKLYKKDFNSLHGFKKTNLSERYPYMYNIEIIEIKNPVEAEALYHGFQSPKDISKKVEEIEGNICKTTFKKELENLRDRLIKSKN